MEEPIISSFTNLYEKWNTLHPSTTIEKDNITEFISFIIEQANQIRDKVEENDDWEWDQDDPKYTLPHLESILILRTVCKLGDIQKKEIPSFFWDRIIRRIKTYNIYYDAVNRRVFDEVDYKYNQNDIQTSYDVYEQECKRTLQNREEFKKEHAREEAEKAEKAKQLIEEKQAFLTKISTVYGTTPEETEAVIFHVASLASKRKQKKYATFTKNTLIALQFLNRYANEKKIRVEDAITYITEHI